MMIHELIRIRAVFSRSGTSLKVVIYLQVMIQSINGTAVGRILLRQSHYLDSLHRRSCNPEIRVINSSQIKASST